VSLAATVMALILGFVMAWIMHAHQRARGSRFFEGR
jgi:ABC-type sulfate transport system permease component